MTVQAARPAARLSRPRNLAKMLFIIPAAAVFGVVVILPIAENLFYAFTDWSGYGNLFTFVGGQNFAKILQDQETLTAFRNTVIFTVFNAPLQIGLGLLLAVTLRKPGRLTGALRTIIVLPIAISGVVLGFLGTIIFDPNSGILKALSAIPGLGFLGANWLGSPGLAMVSVVGMNLWQWTGFTMLIFLAGLSGIPEELYEASRLDGAGAWAQFRTITWPLLAPAATINIVLSLIGGLKVFDIVYVLTQGGPGDATESIVMRVTSEGGFARFGYASAIDFVLTAIILVVSLIALGILRRREIDA